MKSAAYIIVAADAQNALVFVFLPLWQLAGLAPLLFVAWLLRDRRAFTG